MYLSIDQNSIYIYIYIYNFKYFLDTHSSRGTKQILEESTLLEYFSHTCKLPFLRYQMRVIYLLSTF